MKQDKFNDEALQSLFDTELELPQSLQTDAVKDRQILFSGSARHSRRSGGGDRGDKCVHAAAAPARHSRSCDGTVKPVRRRADHGKPKHADENPDAPRAGGFHV